jgi:hypothetical protein
VGLADESLQTRVLRGLADCGFVFNVRDFTEAKQLSDRNRSEEFLGWLEVAQKLALPVIKSTLNVNIPDWDGLHIDFQFDGPGFQEVLDKLSRFVEIACFRYVLSQPIVVGVMYDAGADIDLEAVCDGFDSAMDAFRNHTATMAHTKMSVTGILLWCFTKSEDAHSFTSHAQEKLRRRHFWAKLNTVSWCVDLQAGKVSKHKGIPIIVKSLFDTGQFELSLKTSA